MGWEENPWDTFDRLLLEGTDVNSQGDNPSSSNSPSTPPREVIPQINPRHGHISGLPRQVQVQSLSNLNRQFPLPRLVDIHALSSLQHRVRLQAAAVLHRRGDGSSATNPSRPPDHLIPSYVSQAVHTGEPRPLTPQPFLNDARLLASQPSYNDLRMITIHDSRLPGPHTNMNDSSPFEPSPTFNDTESRPPETSSTGFQPLMLFPNPLSLSAESSFNDSLPLETSPSPVQMQSSAVVPRQVEVKILDETPTGSVQPQAGAQIRVLNWGTKWYQTVTPPGKGFLRPCSLSSQLDQMEQPKDGVILEMRKLTYVDEDDEDDDDDDEDSVERFLPDSPEEPDEAAGDGTRLGPNHFDDSIPEDPSQ
ncbi:uncharacterized protein LOC109607745 [Aethina tumida]|uniref:uncharacterized protein LOC109607745 n=1 Tax=Aethina tumida TaxID=116153 RepID=UPI00096B48C3|nr:uncharacterized protein LOC109607745 [Aethina tumida]